MKKFLTAVVAALALSFTGHAQSVIPTSPLYVFTPATATGAVLPYLQILDTVSAPSSYTISVKVLGTVPSACTFEVESSDDGVNWSTGATSLSAAQSCAVPAGTSIPYSFAYKPVPFIQIKVLTLTGADGTTQVVFSYTKGK